MPDIKELKHLTKDFSVLYVEDDDAARNQVEDILKMLFKETFVAGNGIEGIDIYKNNSHKIDLILTDVQMPVMDGLKMSAKIKELDSDKHVIIISAHNDVNYFSEAIDLGVDGFIIKPVATDKLLHSLKKACGIISRHKMEERYHEEIEKRLAERTRELESNIITDELTKLYNKTKLNLELAKNTPHHIILINLDNFDHINSTYGYNVGDTVLKKCAEFLKLYKPLGAELFRLAGDEFVYLLNVGADFDIAMFVETLQYSLRNEDFVVQDIEIHLSASVGIAGGVGAQSLADAHIAMKEIRESGKSRYQFYNPNSELQTKQKNNIEWMRKVKIALEKDTIIPYFQPIVNNDTGKIEKYECLARIIEDNRIITPNHFIEPARLVGMLPTITRTMLKKSFETFSLRNEEFSINICEHDLKEGYLPSFLEELLKRYSINPNRVVVEVLENISAHGSEEALDQLKEIKRLGVKIALDDFGSEKSNFYRLQELNVDYIKIDGSFIKNITSNQNCYQISKTITQMAKGLNAKTIAEFVCNEDIQHTVLELGIDYSQGYFFGKPMDKDEIGGDNR